MMLDANVVACSAATVSRVLSDAGLLRRNLQRFSTGTGFQQPLLAHDHWHIEISCLDIAGTFYFMATILDGFSRSIVHWDIRHQGDCATLGNLRYLASRVLDGASRVAARVSRSCQGVG